MDWDRKQSYRAAIESVAHGIAGKLTPTERAESEYQAAMTRRTPWNGSGLSDRTRHPHAYCAGGCGVAGDPEHPRHIDHACGCGTHSRRRCGGRWWAGRYANSLVLKSDATQLLARKGWTR